MRKIPENEIDAVSLLFTHRDSSNRTIQECREQTTSHISAANLHRLDNRRVAYCPMREGASLGELATKCHRFHFPDSPLPLQKESCGSSYAVKICSTPMIGLALLTLSKVLQWKKNDIVLWTYKETVSNLICGIVSHSKRDLRFQLKTYSASVMRDVLPWVVQWK